MILNREEILAAIADGEIKIDPMKPEHFGPNSYDLTMADEVQVLEKEYPDFFYFCPTEQGKAPSYRTVKLPFFLLPGRSVRCATKETIAVKTKTLGMVMKRSNLSRFPVQISHGELVDTGYEGILSFVITNNHNVSLKLESGMRTLQIMFHSVTPPTEKYFERSLSKNSDQKAGVVPGYNVDKEHRRK